MIIKIYPGIPCLNIPVSLICCFLLAVVTSYQAISQDSPHRIRLKLVKGESRVQVTDNGKPFTSFLFPDTLEKPVLYPIYAPDEEIITRGFPLLPRKGEPTDHPHHVGLWLNYENVNGLDFWNNSYAIPADKKDRYGWIITDSLPRTVNGNKGILQYHAVWVNSDKHILLDENTSYFFRAYSNMRWIDRITTLTAREGVTFPDSKDGMLGLRVARELELPSDKPASYKDHLGKLTWVHGDTTSTGNYLNSEGISGDSVWGTRGKWCMLSGKMQGDSIAIVILDHPRNPGYPTYWHARGYGLFAANPLGPKIFTNGRETLGFNLKKGQTVTFRYRIVITSGHFVPDKETIRKISDDFARTY